MYLLYLKSWGSFNNAAVRFNTGLHFGRLCTEEIHMWGNKSPVIEHVLETWVPLCSISVCVTPSWFGEETVRELSGEWHNNGHGWKHGEQQYLPQQEAVQQCKLNLIIYMSHLPTYTTGKQHLCAQTQALFFWTGFIHVLYSCKWKCKKLTLLDGEKHW